MNYTTMTSREFNQDTSGAKRAAAAGPVFITDRGQPAHVLMTVETYRRLAGLETNLADLLGMDDCLDVDIDFDPPRSRDLHRPAEIG